MLTGTTIRNAGGGGTAYINSFNWSTDDVALVFNKGEYAGAETVSHEVGHTLNLYHDGGSYGSNLTYYEGHGSGATSWGTIMGAPFINGDENVTTWSKGEYIGADNTEDDLAIITTQNGFSYRVDDYGNNDSSAYELSGTSLSQFGIIERNTDVDWFSFTTGSGSINLNIDNSSRVYIANGDGTYTIQYLASRGPNLDIGANLYDSNGTLVASSNPLDQLNVNFTNLNLTAGIYYLSIEGVGVGNPFANPPTGYTDYGSLGQYLITGTIVTPVVLPGISVNPTSGLTTTEAGGTATFTLVLDSQPTADVTIGIRSSDETEGTVDVNSLTFTSDNWNLVQTVTVTGVDDLLVDGDVSFLVITDPASSGDSNYSGLDGSDVSVVNLDNDIASSKYYYAIAGNLVNGNVNYTIAPAVTGNYTATQTSDNSYQQIREGEINLPGGGNKRTSGVDYYQWEFTSLQNANRFAVEAYRSANSEGDAFQFQVSSNGGITWTDLTAVDSSSEQVYQVDLSANPLSGSVLVRVQDTNRSRNQTNLDSLYVDQIYFQADRTDLRPRVAIAASDPSAGENPLDTGSFTISREGTSGDIEVFYSLSGSASNGSDYQTLSGSVTIADGFNSATLTLTPIDDNLAEGVETVTVTLLDGETYQVAADNSATATIADDDLTAIEFTADSEQSVVGTVSGTYLNTHTSDNIRQTISERESGGRPSDRYSYLEHRWTFNNLSNAHSFSMEASRPDNSEGDDFQVEYSTNGGITWLPLFTVNSATEQVYSANLSSPLSGTAVVRVMDTDRSSGNRTSDSVSIDQMYFSTDLAGSAVPGSDPLTGLEIWAGIDGGERELSAGGVEVEELTPGEDLSQIPSQSGDWGLVAGTTSVGEQVALPLPYFNTADITDGPLTANGKMALNFG